MCLRSNEVVKRYGNATEVSCPSQNPKPTALESRPARQDVHTIRFEATAITSQGIEPYLNISYERKGINFVRRVEAIVMIGQGLHYLSSCSPSQNDTFSCDKTPQFMAPLHHSHV